MKILSVSPLAFDEVKLIRFARFSDHRGYFTEPFRRSDLDTHPELGFLRGVPLPQVNESVSRPGVVRGLHFQWDPGMGKLVRTLHGRMVDIFMDIRLGSPTFGKIAMHDMKSTSAMDYGEWIWIPPGFAHGNFFTEETRIEYFCSAEYKPACEAGISPLAPDFDWSLCDQALKSEFERILAGAPLISDKDRHAPSLAGWKVDSRSGHFVYDRAPARPA